MGQTMHVIDMKGLQILKNKWIEFITIDYVRIQGGYGEFREFINDFKDAAVRG